MAWAPISNTVPQYSKNAGGAAASDYYIKFYADGTTTPINMATDSTGGTTLAKCKLNSLGYPINGSGDVFIPHIDQTYKLALYENATDADANTLASAAWVVDNLSTSATSTITSTSGTALTPVQWVDRQVQKFATISSLGAESELSVGDYVVVANYTATNGSGPLFGEIVANGTGTDDGGQYITLAGSTTQFKQSFPDGEHNFKKFGAEGDGSTNDASAINNCIAAGGLVSGNAGSTFMINSEIDLDVAGVTLDLKGGTIKALSTFPNTDNLISITAESILMNGTIDGNQANLTASFSAGSTGCCVLVEDGADGTRVKGIAAKNSPTNGLQVLGNALEDIAFDDCTVDGCQFTSFGVEIATVGTTPKNIRFSNIVSTGGALGGVRIAGCDDLVMDNCKVYDAGNLAAYFYIGDAKGGLRNCQVSDCIFETANNSVSAISLEGEVQTGALAGQQDTCEVTLSNVKGIGAGGGTLLRMQNGAKLFGDYVEVENGGIGFYPDTSSYASIDTLKVKTVTDKPVLIDSIVYIRKLIAEFWGATAAGLTFSSSSTGAVIESADLGATTGETGQHGVAAVSTPTNIRVGVDKFTGSGTKINVSSSTLAAWIVRQDNYHRSISLEDGVGAPAATSGQCKLYVDNADGDLKIIFGDGTVKTIVTDT